MHMYVKNFNDILFSACVAFFKELESLNNSYNFNELSMGMSSDYLLAASNSATFLRIGSSIFGSRV